MRFWSCELSSAHQRPIPKRHLHPGLVVNDYDFADREVMTVPPRSWRGETVGRLYVSVAVARRAVVVGVTVSTIVLGDF